IGYFISKEGANKLLQQGNLPRMPADFLTTNSPKYKVKLGISNYPIIWAAENSEVSLIGGERGHPSEDVKVIEIQKDRPKNLTERLKHIYRALRSTYHKTKRVMYGKVIQF